MGNSIRLNDFLSFVPIKPLLVFPSSFTRVKGSMVLINCSLTTKLLSFLSFFHSLVIIVCPIFILSPCRPLEFLFICFLTHCSAETAVIVTNALVTNPLNGHCLILIFSGPSSSLLKSFF